MMRRIRSIRRNWSSKTYFDLLPLKGSLILSHPSHKKWISRQIKTRNKWSKSKVYISLMFHINLGNNWKTRHQISKKKSLCPKQDSNVSILRAVPFWSFIVRKMRLMLVIVKVLQVSWWTSTMNKSISSSFGMKWTFRSLTWPWKKVS